MKLTLTFSGVRTERVPPSDGTYTFFSKRIFSEVDDVEDDVMVWMWRKLFTAQPLRTRAARTRLLQWDNIVASVGDSALFLFLLVKLRGPRKSQIFEKLHSLGLGWMIPCFRWCKVQCVLFSQEFVMQQQEMQEP